MSERVCVIGAGSAGMTTIKALVDGGLSVDCFEMGSDIGGNWRYGNDNGRSSAYESLHIDTSKDRMQYADLPMPDEYPNFPHHSQVLEYFEQYAQTFNLRDHITFRTKVVQVVPRGVADGYAVTVENVDMAARETRDYTAVVVCNGHHWHPKRPHFPGEFTGESTHSHHYRTPEPYAGQRVLVVGIGNSGADISCEVSRVAARTFLSMRRNPRIIPRYVMGRPLDKWDTPFSSLLPLWIRQILYRIILGVTVGRQDSYGFPPPDHAVLTEHPTVSSELLNIVAHGGIDLRPNVAQLNGRLVRFEDGREEMIDAVIYATGYKIAFPFFADDFFSVEDNQVALYRKVVDPLHPGLYFVGLIQPLGAIMPLAEEQARWVADLISGRGILPPTAEMQRDIHRKRDALAQRYVRSMRHTIQVDFFPYKRRIQQERAACRART